MQKYEVGSVLYLIPSGNFIAVPGQVVEEITRKSISGENIDYHVSIPGKEKTILLKDFDGDIFQDIPELKTYLLEIATSKVYEIIEKAEELAKSHFDLIVQKPLTKNTRQKKSSKKKLDSIAKVDLGNGQSAKIIVNDELKELLS